MSRPTLYYICLSLALTSASLCQAPQYPPSSSQSPAPSASPAAPISSPAPAVVSAVPARPAPAAKPGSSGPSDDKAKATYAEGTKLFHEHKYTFALDNFRKADKQDGGHCVQCEIDGLKAAREIQDFKAEREEATALLQNVTQPADKAQAHFLLGGVCLAEGILQKHDKALQSADSEFQAALEIQPGKSDCLYQDGVALAHLKEDGAARERFQQFLKAVPPNDLDYARAQRFAEFPELARARVAPNFRVHTLDGKTVTLESLAGKVVLIDFWATWCGPCREALPHVRDLARRFAGQPFVVVSVSLDQDDARWKEFVAKNDMTWPQYRDGRFDGDVARAFAVTAIPATFTIDADGVLQDQHVGDADIEGKIKKLIARAVQVQNRNAATAVAATGGAH
jgi:thiol-disulfide isomerase/thioredoxin